MTTLTDDQITWLDDSVQSAAKIAVQRWRDVQEFEDWRQDGWEALLRHPAIHQQAYLLDDDEQAAKYVLTGLLNEHHKKAIRERARRIGGSPSDQAFYTVDSVAAALPYALSSDPAEWSAPDSAPDPDELQRGSGDPAKGGTRLAVAVDIQRAYSKLGLQDAWILRRYFIDRESQTDIAQVLGVARVTVQRYLDRALAAMVAHLGGDRPSRLPTHRLTNAERYAAHRTRSNADSIRELQEVYNG